VFSEAHGLASTDFVASKLGVSSEEAEKLLNALKREGRVTYDPAKEVWR
jgi:Mn-dependent DtxR family transcriptional regulator